MTELVYLSDSYQKELKTRIVSCIQKGNVWKIILKKTIFYPQSGGQLSDEGIIIGLMGKARVKHVRMQEINVIHECAIEGTFHEGDDVECRLDWNIRYTNMRLHSAGHIIHEAVRLHAPYLEPTKADHGKHCFIEYRGSLPTDKRYEIESTTNEIIKKNPAFVTCMVTFEELAKRVANPQPNLPRNKPLRILQIGDFPPIPDGGTQVHSAHEIGAVSIQTIENSAESVRVYYTLEELHKKEKPLPEPSSISAPACIGELLEIRRSSLDRIKESEETMDQLRISLLGPKSELSRLSKQIRQVPSSERQQVGIVLNEVKQAIETALKEYSGEAANPTEEKWFDVTTPGIRPPHGHLHIVTQAIMEITRIFERIGFTRVRYPEADWDWYAFESLNMPPNHPARDEWETFLIEYTGTLDSRPGLERKKIILTPHTSNGQVREMEKGKLPIRMINIAKCYRRQIDISHAPMFHQFEGLYIDKHVSIGHLKGVCEYFFQQFYGYDRKARLRPFHFQFTEPSFEIDVSCGICHGKGMLSNGTLCKLCKDGWLELGGAGMVHPIVLKNGGIDPDTYTGFAFGWGIERTYMMKSETELDDIRLLYNNDIRFLEQF